MNEDFLSDMKLQENLLVHLFQLSIRARSSSTVLNPSLYQIRHDYPALYGVVWITLKEFFEKQQYIVSPDEVGFVVIHFQASIERNKRMKKVLYVCPNGIGMSTYIASKVQTFLPKVTTTRTVSLVNLTDKELEDVDFIISTVPIKTEKVPCVVISPMVTIEDIKHINAVYIEKFYEENLEKTVPDFLPNVPIFFFEKDIKNENEAIDFLISQLSFLSMKEKKKYQYSVIQREKIQPTYLDNGVCIPHGNPIIINKSSINVLQLEKKIDWGTNKVDTVILLSISQNDRAVMENVMSRIINGVEHKHNLKGILKGGSDN